MKEIILLSLAVFGLHTFAQNTERTNVKTAPNTTVAPNSVPNATSTPRTVPNTMASPNAQPSPRATPMDQSSSMNANRLDGSMNSNVPPINTPNRTNGSMNSNVPASNGNLNNNYPSTRARDAARQGMPSRPTSSDRTLPRTN